MGQAVIPCCRSPPPFLIFEKFKNRIGGIAMFAKNDGITESDILQNQFTAYLITALRRRKVLFLQKKATQLSNEIFPDEEFLANLPQEQDFLKNASVLELLENPDLLQALKALKARDLEIFLLKVVEEQTFAEIGKVFDLGYNGVAAVYYRVLKRLQEQFGGEGK